jgi:hypothetical protein
VIYFGLEYEAKEKLNKEPGNISVLSSTFGKDFDF